MDKDHLIELISNSLIYESKNSDSSRNLCDFRNFDELNFKFYNFFRSCSIFANLEIS